MYFSVIEAVPEPDSDVSQKYVGCHVACWINSTDWKQARERAIALVASAGWIVSKIVEEKEVSAENYTPGDPAMDYFEQAITDDEVCVIYTFPRN